MKLIDIINGYWAIHPNMLNEIISIYEKHTKHEKIDIKKIEAQIGKPLQKNEQGISLQKGVAIIPIEGTIAKKMNLVSEISGGASTQLIERDFKEALANPDVKSIIFDIDSPGGTVDGTFELANMIFNHRGKKPMVAFTDGLMTSAAYLIGAAVGKIFISGETVSTGSIAILTQHTDISKAEEKEGIKTTILSSAELKKLGNQFEPLSEESKNEITAQLNYLHGVFASDVSLFRDIEIDKVLNEIATGRIFIGSQGIKAGLVDKIITFDQLINDMSNAKLDKNGNITKNQQFIKGVGFMKYEDFKKENPEEAKKTEINITNKAIDNCSLDIRDALGSEREENAKLKTELEKISLENKDLDKRLAKIQVSANEKNADKILIESLSKKDFSEPIKNKILTSHKPNINKYLGEDGSLVAADYQAEVDKEISSWEEIGKEVEQSVGATNTKDLNPDKIAEEKGIGHDDEF